MPLLLVGQVHVGGDDIDLLRRNDVLREKRIDIAYFVLQGHGGVVVGAAEFQHREHGRMNNQHSGHDGTLALYGQYLRTSRRA